MPCTSSAPTGGSDDRLPVRAEARGTMPLTHRPLHLGPLDNNTFILVDPATREAAVVDVGFEAEAVIDAVRGAGLTTRWLLNTHAHYDHVAGMRQAQEALG